MDGSFESILVTSDGTAHKFEFLSSDKYKDSGISPKSMGFPNKVQKVIRELKYYFVLYQDGTMEVYNFTLDNPEGGVSYEPFLVPDIIPDTLTVKDVQFNPQYDQLFLLTNAGDIYTVGIKISRGRSSYQHSIHSPLRKISGVDRIARMCVERELFVIDDHSNFYTISNGQAKLYEYAKGSYISPAGIVDTSGNFSYRHSPSKTPDEYRTGILQQQMINSGQIQILQNGHLIYTPEGGMRLDTTRAQPIGNVQVDVRYFTELN